ncbi:glycosyltransferase 87 family protein [Patiriisocius sp. Uisw_047]|uniref:glycosyltransferase 87 family protein n=1 Tax=Patiriisocius sp. Uisw_047 TaxID=3230969 RepID=UPI0039E75109
MTQLKQYKYSITPIIGSVILYVLLAYFSKRSDFLNLLLLYSGLFYCAWHIIKATKSNFWALAGIGVFFRLLFLPSIPNLSQDFYRFLWDGQIVTWLQNPYVFTPEQYVNLESEAAYNNFGVSISNARELVKGMGELNASHYSNYPPINQLCFAIAAFFAKSSILGSVIALRVIIIAADIGILYFGKKLLEKLNLPVKNIFWYFLNPFIIIELTGNLHFEGVMLFFVVWSLYLLHEKKWFWAAVLMGVSVSVKLLPLLFLPLLFKHLLLNQNKLTEPEMSGGADTLHVRKMVLFYAVTLITVALTFAPFLSAAFISNFAATISLWFQNFEFNASVYYIIRWIGYQTVGWNIIETVGKILPLIVITLILYLAFFRRNTTTQQLITAILLAVSFYFLLATTVHPWYIATPLLLSVFTRYKFPIIWSFMVLFSYSAYGVEGFSENLGLVALEYIVVIGVAAYELVIKKPLQFLDTEKV